MQSDTSRPPGPGPVAQGDSRFGAVQRIGSGLTVYPRIFRERELHLMPAGYRLTAERATQLREQRAYGRVRGTWRMLRPEGLNQIGAQRGAGPVHDQKGEQHAPLAPRQRSLHS